MSNTGQKSSESSPLYFGPVLVQKYYFYSNFWPSEQLRLLDIYNVIVYNLKIITLNIEIWKKNQICLLLLED